MDRRTALKLVAATALSGCARREGSGDGLKVVVAGAGIVGASIAYHLAKTGTHVTVIDKEGPATHASRGTFAWINASWAKQPRNYHSLSQEGVSSWRDLAQTLDLPVRWGGSLEWFDDPARQQLLVNQIAEQAEWGEPARIVGTDELSTLEPHVDFSGTSNAAYSGNDGAVDPVGATELLLDAAVSMGATIEYPCELEEVKTSRGRVVAVDTSIGEIEADKVVLATGAAPNAPRQFALSDIPQRTTPGFIVITAPMPRLLNRLVVGPDGHMHQRNDGRIVLISQNGPPQTEAHELLMQGRPNQHPTRALAEQHAARVLAAAEGILPGISGAVVENVYIGWRPLPIDGHPVLGASPARPDVYLAVMHSGVTLAPIVGQLAAYEMTSGVAVERLDEFRPGRKFELIRRY